ncbi:hypothetical protein ACPFTR_003235 [Vibrio cholerae]
MNKLRIITALSLIVSVQASAFSGVVTDLKSYSYYTEQIKNQVEMIEKQESMLKKADESIKLAETTKRSLEGAYRKAKRQSDNLIYDIERARDNPLQTAIKIEDKLNEMKPAEVRSQISDQIDDIYSYDSTSPWQRNDKAHAEAQRSVKRLMVLSEEASLLSSANLSEASRLMEAANSAETQKEATDVTNAILTEMLKNQNRIIDLMSAFQTTFAKIHYSGETKEAPKTSKSDEFQEELSGYLGASPQEMQKSKLDKIKKMSGSK